MNELNRELFGSSDSDSGSEVETGEDTAGEERQAKEQDNLDDDGFSLEADPIFKSIMEGPYDDINGDLDLSSDRRSHTTQTLQPQHEPHPHIPGLCLHTGVLSDADHARLMAQITEKNFFKAGQQNQAMCFGERDLVWLEWLLERMVEMGVLREPYCGSEWTGRKPLFDQSIMNLYYPGNGHESLSPALSIVAAQICATDAFNCSSQ